MSTVLYIVDKLFTDAFAEDLEAEGRSGSYPQITERLCGEFHVMTRPDKLVGESESSQLLWNECIDEFLEAIEPHVPTRVIILGHKGIFREQLRKLEIYNVESRIRTAEHDLLQHFTHPPVPAISIYGFHHEPHSEIWQLISRPRELAVPGTLARLRSIVDDGGGPLGRLSALKHELMRPFASVRLQLQLEAERGAQQFDSQAVTRVSSAIAEGRSRLIDIQASFELTREFDDAVRDACRLLDEDLGQITSHPDRFNGWMDRLNNALDAVRRQA